MANVPSDPLNDIGPVTLKSYCSQLRHLWLADPTLSRNEFFELAIKLFSLVKDENKKFINFNKRWCSRFFKKLLSESHP